MVIGKYAPAPAVPAAHLHVPLQPDFGKRGGEVLLPVIATEKCQSCIGRCMDRQSPAER